jgi:penicillin-binding protein 2
VSDRSNLRLLVLGALLFSLIATMGGRLFYLQVVAAADYTRIGTNNGVRDVITPAARGLILDQAGRPLVSNRTSLVVSLDRAALEEQKDHGKAVLTRLAGPLHTTYAALAERIALCGTPGAVRGVCWNGSPFQPIPVAKDVSTDLALSIMERRADYPGVVAQLESVRDYPDIYGVNAAQLLGYLGAVSQSELDKQKKALADGELSSDQATLTGTDLVGRSGLEEEYDSALRGTAGVKKLSVDIAANVLGTTSETDPVPGDYLVTNLDARLQSTVEKQLLAAVKRARASTKPGTSQHYKADSAAAVVLDVTNGHVLAMASYPSYDPQVWVGGISTKEYKKLTAKKSNYPLISRAYQGLFAPASTFKIATTSAALMHGYSMDQTYDCPSQLTAGGRTFHNNEGEAHGMITFKRAIELSCDTIFYGVAKHFWEQDGGLSATHDDAIVKMAKAYGMGERTGIDLPSEAAGDLGGFEYRKTLTERYQDDWCANKDDPRYSKKLRELYAYNCQYGYRYQIGDAANTAIGQGDTLITPLQLAQAYAALANGGTIYRPQVAKAIMSPQGKVVKTFKPVKAGKLPVSKSVQDYLRSAFKNTTVDGTGAGAFTNFPLGKIGGVATKTGTGQVANKQSTSWFASYAPANDPKYAVVMMVSQGGYGVTTSGPSVRKIYEKIFGVKGMSVDPARSVLVGGAPEQKLPTIGADGTPVYPGPQASQSAGAAGTSDSPKAKQSAAKRGDGAVPDQSTPASGAAALVPFGVGLGLLRRRSLRPRRRPPSVGAARAGPGGRSRRPRWRGGGP